MKKLSYFHMNLEGLLTALNALANRIRLKTFLILLDGEFCVCELQRILNIEQSRLSHQLKVLKYSGLVETKQDGRWIFYYVPEEIKNNEIIKAIKKSIQLSPTELEKIKEIKRERTGGKECSGIF